MKTSEERVIPYIREVVIYETYVSMPLKVWENSEFGVYAQRSPYYKTIRKYKNKCTCVIIGSQEEVKRDINRLHHYGEVIVTKVIERPKKERRIAFA